MPGAPKVSARCSIAITIPWRNTAMRHLFNDLPMDDKDALPPRPRRQNWPASSTVRAQEQVKMLPEGVCPECAGAGYYTLAVPAGHPDFGKLLPCACLVRRREAQVLGRAAQRREALLAELSRTLGRLSAARFETFDLKRPLADLVWGGETFAVDMQRLALAQALEDAQRYADHPQGWLYLCGPCGAGKSRLAAAIANHVATRSLGAAYASTPDVLRFVRRGIADGAADERLDALASPYIRRCALTRRKLWTGASVWAIRADVLIPFVLRQVASSDSAGTRDPGVDIRLPQPNGAVGAR
jgi:hypothetical protein